jgi:hypothetical protein
MIRGSLPNRLHDFKKCYRFEILEVDVSDLDDNVLFRSRA